MGNVDHDKNANPNGFTIDPETGKVRERKPEAKNS